MQFKSQELKTETLIEIVARTLKNEVKAQMRNVTTLETCEEAAREFVKVTLGSERRQYWSEEGMTVLNSRYILPSDSLLEDVLALRPSEVIRRMKYWFGGSDSSTSTSNQEDEESSLVKQMVQLGIRPFPYLDFQEGTNWCNLIETPEDFSSRYLDPADVDPKKKATETFENAIGILVITSYHSLLYQSNIEIEYTENDPSNNHMWNHLGISYKTMKRRGGFTIFSKRKDESASEEDLLKAISAFCNSLTSQPLLTAALANIGTTLFELAEKTKTFETLVDELTLSGFLALVWCLSVDIVLPQDTKPPGLARTKLVYSTGTTDSTELLPDGELAVRVLKVLFSNDTAGISAEDPVSFIIDRISSEQNPLKLALLLSVLHLILTDSTMLHITSSLPESKFSTLIQALLGMLHQSPLNSAQIEYLPSKCVTVIPKLQMLVMLDALAEKYNTLFHSAVRAQGVEAITAIAMKNSANSHRLLLQLGLNLLRRAPIEQSHTFDAWCIATRLIDHPSSSLSNSAMEYFFSYIDQELSSPAELRKAADGNLLRAFLRESGVLALSQIISNNKADTANVDRVMQCLRLMEKLLKVFKGQNKELVEAIKKQPAMLLRLKSIYEMSGDKKEIGDTIINVLKQCVK